MEASSTGGIVLKEQAFLETYFQCLSKFAHDKAKEMIEREREATKTRASLLWTSTLHLLNTFVTSEKEFFSLVFLSPNLGSRLLGRKDALRTTYGCLLTELRKIENTHKARKDAAEDLEQLLGQLSAQLQHYIVARINTIAFYEQLLAMSAKSHMALHDLNNAIVNISRSCQDNLKHTVLGSLKQSFELECGSIMHLLQAHSYLQKVEFLLSLRSLYDAHVKLNAWGSAMGSREVKKLGFVSSSTKVWVPELYDWMVKFKGVLVAKFSFFFYDVLSKHGPPNEFKTFLSKTYIDFYAKTVTFVKKSDATSVSLMLNPTEFVTKLHGYGYHLPSPIPEEPPDTPPGYDSENFICSHPPERPDKHWPTLLTIITRKQQDLNADRQVYYFDEKLQSTYFLIRIDPGIYLIIIFETKKQERDTFIQNFLQTTCYELRLSKVLAAMKPGSK